MKNYFLSLLLILFFQSSLGQTPAFNRYSDPFSGGYYNYIGNATTDVVQLENSDLLLTASVHSYPALMRTDKNGVEKWTKVLYSSDYIFNLIQLIPYDATTVYILGNVSFSAPYGLVLIKADTAGNIIWSKHILKGSRTIANSMIKTYDNNFVVFASDSGDVSLLMKFDTSGGQIWSRRFFTNYQEPLITGIPYGGYGPFEGPGNIVELPDHSITMATNTILPFSINGTTTYNVATIIKTSENGNILWAKKLQPLPGPFGYFRTDPLLSYVGDIFYTSDNNYLLAIGGNYTLRADSNGNVIPGYGVYGQFLLNFVSEYPAGNINIVENGSNCCGDVILGAYNFVLFHASPDFLSVRANSQQVPASFLYDQNSYTSVGHVRQLSDKRIACTGSLTYITGSNFVSTLIITDSIGHEDCTAQDFPYSPGFDSGLHSYPAPINTDSGITIQSFVVSDSLVTIYHCNCDSLPKAKFGVTNYGLTVYCHDSSHNALTYLWNFGDGTTDTARNPVHNYSNLYYTITLTVYNNCGNDVYSYHLYPSLVNDSLQPACNGTCTGYARIKAFGGTSPYTYSWNTVPAQTAATAGNLCPGAYQATVTDANAVSSTINITVTSDTLSANTIQQSNLICNGFRNGSATIAVTAGTPPYTYSWSNTPSADTTTLADLPAGITIVSVTDSFQCKIKDTIIILQPAQITFSNSIYNNPCYKDSLGYIQTSVLGGTPPYTYIWDNDTMQNIPYLADLPASTHILLIKDSNSCVINDTVTITQPSPLNDLPVTSTPSCNNSNNGSIQVIVSGGTQPYQYTWNTTPLQTTSAIHNLYAGTYEVNVTDAHNCFTTDTIILIAPVVLADSSRKLDVTCNGRHTGVAIIHPYGGTLPYNITWTTTPQTQDTAYTLYAGSYPVIITDANNCTHTDTISIAEPPALIITIIQTQDSGDCTGTAAVQVTGGTGHYRYHWSNNDTTQTINDLCGGTYTVIVADSNNCIIVDSIEVQSTSGVKNVAFGTNINVIPNPFGDFLTVDWSKTTVRPAQISIMGTNGVSVFSCSINDDKVYFKKISTSLWTPGFYFITIFSEKNVVLMRKKLVKL